jgi:hypothetical protein
LKVMNAYEMRELQLHDIAIPCLGVLDLFVMR